MMQHNDDCAREPAQYLNVPVFRPTVPVSTQNPVLEIVPELQETPVNTGSQSVPDATRENRLQSRVLLGLAVVVPVGILICYQPVIGLVMLVSAGLYLANEHIDRVMTGAGSDS